MGVYLFLFGALALAVILSLRSATASLGRMARMKPTTGLKIAHAVSVVAYCAAIGVGALYTFGLLFLLH